MRYQYQLRHGDCIKIWHYLRGVTGITTAVITESWVRSWGQYSEIKISADVITGIEPGAPDD